MLRDQGRDQEAEAILGMVLANARQSIPASAGSLARPQRSADALYGQGKLEEAAAEYREALRLRNDVAQVRGSLVHTLDKLGRLDEAIVVSREGVRLRPDDVEARYAPSRELRGAGLYDESLAEIKRARELALKNQVGRPASEERVAIRADSGTL